MNTNARITPVAAVQPAAIQPAALTTAQSTTTKPTPSQPTDTAPQPAAAPEPAQQSPAEVAASLEGSARYRLVIEEGPSKGSFVYKTLDSVTGEVVRQFPREQVLRLAESKTYDAGSVIDTSV
jgi:flagellar protein FlaG